MANKSITINEIAKYANIPDNLKSEFEILPEGETYYHITNISNSSKLKIPINIPRTYLNKENNTILRVCVSDTIINCIIGIHGVCSVVDWRSISKENSIYEITPDVILQPSAKIIPDVKHTNEKWLVNYDGKHNEYTFNKIGSIISIVQLLSNNKELIDDKDIDWKLKNVIALRITKRVRLYKDQYLDPGYYKIVCCQDESETPKQKKFYLPEIRTNVTPNVTKKEVFNEYFGNENFTIEKYSNYNDLKSEMVALANTLPF